MPSIIKSWKIIGEDLTPIKKFIFYNLIVNYYLYNLRVWHEDLS